MNRHVLILSSFALGLLGLSIISIPFVSSMGFSERALADRPHIRIDDLTVGDFRLEPPNTRSYYGGFLVYRDTTDDFYIWRIPMAGGQVVLPDLKWGRWGWLCANFALDKETNVFMCMDEDLQRDEWIREEMRWDTKGRNLGKYTEDMVVARGERNGSYFVSNEPYKLRR